MHLAHKGLNSLQALSSLVSLQLHLQPVGPRLLLTLVLLGLAAESFLLATSELSEDLRLLLRLLLGGLLGSPDLVAIALLLLDDVVLDLGVILLDDGGGLLVAFTSGLTDLLLVVTSGLPGLFRGLAELIAGPLGLAGHLLLLANNDARNGLLHGVAQCLHVHGLSGSSRLTGLTGLTGCASRNLDVPDLLPDSIGDLLGVVGWGLDLADLLADDALGVAGDLAQGLTEDSFDLLRVVHGGELAHGLADHCLDLLGVVCHLDLAHGVTDSVLNLGHIVDLDLANFLPNNLCDGCGVVCGGAGLGKLLANSGDDALSVVCHLDLAHRLPDDLLELVSVVCHGQFAHRFADHPLDLGIVIHLDLAQLGPNDLLKPLSINSLASSAAAWRSSRSSRTCWSLGSRRALRASSGFE
mmetsp:Transcript_3743/g.8821  ORF Transcript_3743/g.8821 Transcript_3743/m.8821 type:complete len:411 (-) Transcript_3743:981-2213(-)